jgi:hypothetical protein
MIKKLEMGMQVYEIGEIKGFENCGVDIKEVDYSLKERVSTKKSKFLRALTGFEEEMFILIGEVRKDEEKTGCA